MSVTSNADMQACPTIINALNWNLESIKSCDRPDLLFWYLLEYYYW